MGQWVNCIKLPVIKLNKCKSSCIYRKNAKFVGLVNLWMWLKQIFWLSELANYFSESMRFLNFSALGLFDRHLDITHTSGVGGAASSQNNVRILAIGAPLKTWKFDHLFVTSGTKEVYFLKKLNYMNTKI